MCKRIGDVGEFSTNRECNKIKYKKNKDMIMVSSA